MKLIHVINEADVTNGDIIRAKLQAIKLQMLRKEITYEEAKKRAEPIIKEMNEKAAAIAKKNGMRAPKFTFGQLMR